MDEFEAEDFPEEALDLIFFTLAIESFQGIIFLIGLAIVLRASFGITKNESFHGRWVIFYCVLIFIGTGILDSYTGVLFRLRNIFLCGTYSSNNKCSQFFYCSDLLC